MALSPRTFDADGTSRPYLLSLPDGDPVAVVVGLHGDLSSADRMARFTSLPWLSQSGAAVALPQGSRSKRSPAWDLQRDLGPLAALVGHLLEAFPTARAKALVCGMSRGAMMACQLAAAHSPLVGTLGAVAGLRSPASSALESAVPVLAFHGTADRINPYRGHGRGGWKESVPAAAAAWARANGVDPAPAETTSSSHLTALRHGHSGDPGEVVLWACHGAGHTWPGGRLTHPLLRLWMGRTSSEIDATDTLWQFYLRHNPS